MILFRFLWVVALTTGSTAVQGFGTTFVPGGGRRQAVGRAPSVREFAVLKASSSAASSSSSTTVSTDISTTTTTKKATRWLSNDMNKKKQKKTQQSSRRRRSKGGTAQAITEQELIDHVSSLYMRPEDDDDEDSYSTTTSKTDMESSAAHNNNNNNHNRFRRYPALILNADYQPMSYLPLSLWNWQVAIKAVFAGKVTVVDVYPDTYVRAARLEIPLPSVMALNEYVHNNNNHNNPAFTRRNVFLRDGYRCQYCALPFHTRDLSLDHVIPRSRGGRLTWNNAVTCCRQCNGRKGSLLPHQLKSVHMKLLTAPQRPSQHQLAQRAGQMLPRRVHPSWKPYLEAVWSSSRSSESMDH